MKIQRCHIEDNGIGLGIIHDSNGFIPMSYNEGMKFQRFLELMLETCTGDMSYAIECFGNVDFTKMDGQMMLDDFDMAKVYVYVHGKDCQVQYEGYVLIRESREYPPTLFSSHTFCQIELVSFV